MDCASHGSGEPKQCTLEQQLMKVVRVNSTVQHDSNSSYAIVMHVNNKTGLHNFQNSIPYYKGSMQYRSNLLYCIYKLEQYCREPLNYTYILH